jgi:hypothetical protein
MNVLSCRQWKTTQGIEFGLLELEEKILKSQKVSVSLKVSSLRNVIAAYYVFRYQLNRNCTFD